LSFSIFIFLNKKALRLLYDCI